ncbi:hypothetical protein TIFTF001_015391 [Ficus carica]|uniref:Myb/SANT-like domain-containing protein n=1 Tax=Ficus carica TaxID=3494 RepID=A0AA88D8X5_FICCA|nr:hypothetical protein TIFTF001_015391 [Ficus carica]
MSTSTQRKGKGIYINNWTITEDDVLIESLKELYEDNALRAYGGLKDGYFAQLQTMMKFKLPGWKFHKKAKGLYCEPFLHYYSLQEIYGKDSVTGNKGKLKQEDASDEHLNADVEMRSNCDFLMDLNANCGVKSKTEVGESICMEEMSEKYGSMASSVTATRLKIDDLGLKVDSLGLKIDGVVKALSQSREVVDLQAKLVNELNKIEGLNDTHVFQAINILAPRHDFLSLFYHG